MRLRTFSQEFVANRRRRSGSGMSPPVRLRRLDLGLGRGRLSEPLHITGHGTRLRITTIRHAFACFTRRLVARCSARSAAHRLSNRTGEAGSGECNCPRWDLPRHNLDGVPPRADGRVRIFQCERLLRIDIKDGQPAVYVIEQGPSCEKVTSLVEIGDMRHVSVLQDRAGLLVKLRCVRAQKQQCDGEVIEVHLPMLASSLRPGSIVGIRTPLRHLTSTVPWRGGKSKRLLHKAREVDFEPLFHDHSARR